MEKDEYIKTLNDLTNKKELIAEEIKLLNDTYIKNNSKFQLGEKIRIRENERYAILVDHKNGNKEIIIPETVEYAFVYGYDIDRYNNIKYLLLKAKKDGSCSKVRGYYSQYSILEKL